MRAQKRAGKRRPVAATVAKGLLLDVVLIGVGLVIFALFHHVLPSVGILVVDPRIQSEVDPNWAAELGDLFADQATDAPMEPTDAPVGPTDAPIEPTAVPAKLPGEPTAAPENGTLQEPDAILPTLAPSVPPESTPEPVQGVHFEGEMAGEYGAADDAPGAEEEVPAQAYAPGDFSALFDSVAAEVDEPLIHKTEYLSKDISIRIEKKDTGKVVFYVADIYIRHIENLRTAFANNIFGRGQREYAWNISMDSGAVLSVNGDYYGARQDGIVIRNGVLYRDTLYQDVCVLYADGEMETYYAQDFDCEAAVERGAWQAWSFGPMLLDEDGKAMSMFNSAVVNHNPRCGIGYYEPGHYCFVVVEGRNDNSRGVTLAEFSLIFEQLGCKAAYNMDGGNTAVMTYGHQLVSEPSQGGRPVSDIIMITEVDGE